MNRPSRPAAIAAALVTAAAAGLAGPAAAQCIEYDFEGFAIGTIVTDQLPGVTFDAVPDSCGGQLPIRVQTPSNGTSSGSRALVIDTGCPDFSPDFIRMNFDEPQRFVRFTTGIASGDLRIRVFTTDSGGSPAQSFDVGSNFGEVRTLVQVGDPQGLTANITRIEVESLIDDFEGIDDLAFGVDLTPPIARIDTPTWGTCICGPVAIVGEACDPDGTYGNDTLEVRAVNADPDDPWITVGTFFAPLCGGGNLYTFDPAALGLGGGTYVLRLTVTNGCGTSNTAITTVRFDTSPPGISLDSPAPGETVCGVVELCGGLADNCSIASWTVVARQPGGPEIPVGSGSGGECGTITSWNTAGLPDGPWELVIRATDGCGQSSELVRSVVVDSGCRADVNGDGVVDFNDILAVLNAFDVP